MLSYVYMTIFPKRPFPMLMLTMGVYLWVLICLTILQGFRHNDPIYYGQNLKLVKLWQTALSQTMRSYLLLMNGRTLPRLHLPLVPALVTRLSRTNRSFLVVTTLLPRSVRKFWPRLFQPERGKIKFILFEEKWNKKLGQTWRTVFIKMSKYIQYLPW